MNRHDAHVQALIDLLKKDLPAIEVALIKRVAMVMGGEVSDFSMDELAVALLQSKVSVGRMLSALLRCEWLSIQHLLEHANVNEMKQQVALFSHCVDRFNQLQTAVIHAAEKQWQCAIDAERKSRVLAECKASWLEQGQVKFHNYFREVPVSAKVPFIRYENGQYLCVKVTPALSRVFAVSSNNNEAIISSPDRKYNVLVSVFHYRRMELSLSIRDIYAAKQECRSEVRVRLDKNFTVRLNIAGKSTEAYMFDLSCIGAGLCIEKATDVKSGDVIGCVCTLDGVTLDMKQMAVCWTAQTETSVRLGVKLDADAGQRNVIYKYLFVLQQQIAGRIHQLGKPGWMK